MKPSSLKRVIVFCFVLVPVLSSIISTIHLVDLFYLGNPSWISYTVAVAIEVGAVASFLTLSILSRLNKGIVWGMFIILFMMQVIGNVYFSYDWISKKIIADPTWIKNFKEMMEFFVFEIEEKTTKMILSMLIGIPIPLISVFLLKSAADYLGDDKIELAKEELEEKKQETNQIHITEDQNPTKSEEAKLNPVISSNRRRVHPSRS
jgi:hypothetical protein